MADLSAPNPIHPSECDGSLHPQAILGIQLFNQQEFFDAHEELEAAWKDEKGPIRDLYQGILQVAVGYYHLKRGNIIGARKMFKHCRGWLAEFPSICRGVNIGQLVRDYQAVESRLDTLAKESVTKLKAMQFNPIDINLTKRG